MRVTRRSVFETNSSSTHSICVTKSNRLDKEVPHVIFKFGEFGWAYDKLTTTAEKASYLYTGIMSRNKPYLLDSIKQILDRHYVTYEFEKSYSTQHGPYPYTGHIDHAHELTDFLVNVCSDDSKLLRFLFSSESFIITGNDNTDHDVEIHVPYPHEAYYKGN